MPHRAVAGIEFVFTKLSEEHAVHGRPSRNISNYHHCCSHSSYDLPAVLSPEGGPSLSGLCERHSSSVTDNREQGGAGPWRRCQFQKDSAQVRLPLHGLDLGTVCGVGSRAGCHGWSLAPSPLPHGLGGQQASCCCCCDIPPSARDRHLGLRAGPGARPPSACMELAASERQREPAGAEAAGGGGSLPWAACQAPGCHGEAGFRP